MSEKHDYQGFAFWVERWVNKMTVSDTHGTQCELNDLTYCYGLNPMHCYESWVQRRKAEGRIPR